MTSVRRQLPRRRALRQLGGLAAYGAAIAAGRTAWAQAAYPNKTVFIVVPFGGGNAYDQMVRYLADRLQSATGQPFVVDAKQGALGGIAASTVARAAPDGYTILFGANSTHAANVHLFKKLAYDPVADFAPVTTLATIPQVLVVSPSLNVKNLQEFIALARSQPGKLNYGSSSATGRVASVAFCQLAGIEAVHVPYRTSAQAITDLISGQLQFLVTDAALGIAQAQGGKVQALGISSARRVAGARSADHRRKRAARLRVQRVARCSAAHAARVVRRWRNSPTRWCAAPACSVPGPPARGAVAGRRSRCGGWSRRDTAHAGATNQSGRYRAGMKTECRQRNG